MLRKEAEELVDAELLELMKLDPELFELEIEVFSGSVVIRLTIRSKQPGMAEQTGEALLDYIRDGDAGLAAVALHLSDLDWLYRDFVGELPFPYESYG